ncbi:uncharacterized protein PgNI_07340 [Pyricularia grisea]|uniref:Uncharacterized protein n=1 Tax=Pyricularia grisea TaxID=148305 RepID=A0A6P8B3C3_PYRGI|nr:uncharacterized protein PgNI_07340 [Pyricularia grisea]TLD09193.1 hypothetical protein PgNI_07340 [Pyricularia grisea]
MRFATIVAIQRRRECTLALGNHGARDDEEVLACRHLCPDGLLPHQLVRSIALQPGECGRAGDKLQRRPVEALVALPGHFLEQVTAPRAVACGGELFVFDRLHIPGWVESELSDGFVGPLRVGDDGAQWDVACRQVSPWALGPLPVAGFLVDDHEVLIWYPSCQGE